MLLHTCHSLWLELTRVMILIRSYMYATRRGWYTLEAYQDALVHMLWVACTGGLVI